MPLVDISLDMGMLTFASGSHKNGLVFDQKISDESDSQYRKYIRENHYRHRAVLRECGQAMRGWHYGNTIHSAPANDSDQMREVMTVIYMAEGARVVEPRKKWQSDDLRQWLMDLPPGRLAASELNPLLL